MSRRKQSNPKSIKVSADAETEGTERDADVKEEMLFGPDGERGGETQEREMKTEASRLGSPHGSVDSPDHIDVVNTFHSPPHTTSSPPPEPFPASSNSPPRENSPPFRKVVVKVEREESGPHGNDDGHHSDALGDSGSPPADQSATQGLVRHLQLPSDVLYLKELEVNVHGNPTPSWMVCSAIPLPKGSSLGPFAGDMVSSDNIRVGDLIVEFHSKTGHVALVNVAGHSGAWLALLRPAVNGVSRNTLVYLEGGRIWCEIVSDVEIGMELRATFVFDLDDLSVADRELSTAPLSPVPSAAERPPSSASPPLQQSASALQQPSPPGHAALIYGCPFCGVRFSSPRTLQGHLSYYCSKKRSEHIVSPRPRSRRSSESQGSLSMQTDAVRLKQEVDMDASHDGPALQQSPAKGASGVGSKRSATASADNSSSSGRSSPSPPPAKAACLDAQVFQCPMCSYRADKPASLNRHMRIHNRQSHAVGQQETTTAASVRAGSAPGTGSGAGAGAGAGSVPSSATYCKECNIQFSSLGTYRCHKDHYCSQRQVGRSPGDSVKEEGPQFGLMAPASLHGVPADLSAASFQLTSLGQTGLLFPHGQAMAGEAGGLPSGGAMMPGGQAAVILTAPVMTPSGLTSMAIPLPTVLVQSIHNAAAAAAAAHAAGVGAPVSPRAAASPRKSSSPKVSDSSPRSAPEEAHQSKSPKRMHAGDPEDSAKELPLDLSTKRADAEGAGSAEMRFKKETEEEEEEEERSPVSSSAPASHSSPAAGRSGSVEGSSDHHPGPGPSPALSAATPTSMPGLPPPALLKPSLLQGFLPMHPMAAAAGMAGLPVTPQGHAFAAVPPGVSKCTDCNIIFYKHENFLIHKQHYCSGKKLRPSATAPALSPRAAEPDVKPEAPATTTTTTTPEPGTTGRSPQKSPTLNKDHGSGSGGQTRHTSPGPGVVKVPVRGGALVATATAATVGLEDVYYKFFCIPCKIKFSSASNLKAHKEYYCPHGKNSEHTVIVQTPSGEIVGTAGAEQRSPSSSNGSSSPSPGQYCCGQCRATFTSSRLLKLHLCSAEVAQASLLRCSHCDYVTHTDKRLAEHMKVHNPTSAYRCTLCGYRGNTVRGMRMHGKSHTDNGEDFTDSHMIEFQEPPLVPIQANNDHKGPHGPVDVEAELLRLKNEPYKRRRSRKAYEKVDILVPLDEPHSCQLCGECFADPRSLAMHLRIHEIASQYVQEHSRCSQCDYVTKSVEDLRAHMEISHALIAREEKENRPESTSPDRAASLERRGYERVSGLEKRSPVRIKDEPIDRDYDLRGTMPSGSVRDQCRRNGSAPEHSFRDGRSERDSVDYSSQAEERSGDGGSPGEDNPDVGSDACSDKAETVRVKIEPGLVVDRDDDSCNDPPLPITFATPPATSHPPPSSTPSSPASSDPKASAGQARTSPPTTPPGPSPAAVKLEPDFPSHSLPTPNASLFPRFFVAPPSSSCAPPPLVEAAGASSSQERSRTEERAGESSAAAAPYCKNCDISFTYLSTFVAHKKYYCTESAGVAPSATA